MSDAPKSVLELVMERLRKKDAEAGVEDAPLTDEQRAAIADARSMYEARVAERRIMHQATIAAIVDPAERAQREEELSLCSIASKPIATPRFERFEAADPDDPRDARAGSDAR